MDEKINTKPKMLFKIRPGYFQNFFSGSVRFVNNILVFLGLRKKNKYWGIVFDSVSKQPLDPAIVKLVYVDTNNIVKTSVTDLAGQYGFLVKPGKFKLLAKKSNYSFPSKLVSGDSDGIYDHIYHGEFFELAGDYEVVAPNIPLDPIKPDWNQQAKQKMKKTYPYLNLLVHKLITIAFWFGFILIAVFFIHNSPHAALTLRIFFYTYLSVIFFAFVVPYPRLWGRLYSKLPEVEYSKLILELYNANLPTVVLGKAPIEEDGTYFLRANRGKYILNIKRQDSKTTYSVVASLPVSIGTEGVLNSIFYIKHA